MGWCRWNSFRRKVLVIYLWCSRKLYLEIFLNVVVVVFCVVDLNEVFVSLWVSFVVVDVDVVVVNYFMNIVNYFIDIRVVIVGLIVGVIVIVFEIDGEDV